MSARRWGWAASLIASTSACSGGDAVESCGHVELTEALLVLESDLRSASALGVLGTNGCFVEEPAPELGHDPTLADAHGRPFVGARDRGAIAEVLVEERDDRSRPRLGASIATAAAGEASPNPWDVDVDAAGRLWVARYDLPSLAVIDADGSWGGSADLASLADVDGLPEASAVHAHGERVFVALERLDRAAGYVPAGPGLVAIVDRAAPHAVVGSIALLGSNPFGALTPVGGDPDGALVTIATPGDHDAVGPDDGIELVDLVARTATRLVREDALGGSAVAAVLAAPGEGYAIVEGAVPRVNPTRLVAFDPDAGVVTRTLAEAEGFYFSGLVVSGAHIILGDRDPSAPRLRVFDRATGDELASIPVGLYAPLGLSVIAR